MRRHRKELAQISGKKDAFIFYKRNIFAAFNKAYTLTQTYIIAGACFAGGFILALIIHLVIRARLKKELKSALGFLESEKLMKETLKKENSTLFQLRQANETDLVKKLQQAEDLNKRLDEDILLLQKSNEETEEQLRITQPELHAIKLKLLEAQNTIARYKGQSGK
ncbi:MAG: hypothetical protein H7X88_03365 [Gloeobacteraceae cyanobacterium ES-bin-316]|nr:hypothetical protein [Ferruginibacter sp.]